MKCRNKTATLFGYALLLAILIHSARPLPSYGADAATDESGAKPFVILLVVPYFWPLYGYG